MIEIEIVTEKENPVFERKEITFRARYDGEATPTRNVLREHLAAAVKANKKNVIIETVENRYGVCESTCHAKVYSSVEAAKKYERKHILKRNGLVEEEKKAEE